MYTCKLLSKALASAVVVLGIVAAASGAMPVDNELPDSGCYNGIIGDKHAFRLFLDSDGGKLYGDYYYEKNGPSAKLSISGTIDKGRIVINEYDKKGKHTGVFTGTFDPDSNRVNGTWSKPDGGKSSPFAFWHVECRQ